MYKMYIVHFMCSHDLRVQFEYEKIKPWKCQRAQINEKNLLWNGPKKTSLGPLGPAGGAVDSTAVRNYKLFFLTWGLFRP